MRGVQLDILRAVAGLAVLGKLLVPVLAVQVNPVGVAAC